MIDDADEEEKVRLLPRFPGGVPSLPIGIIILDLASIWLILLSCQLLARYTGSPLTSRSL